MGRKADRRELFKNLKAGQIAPIYYVHGPDTFMLDTAVDAIVKAAAPEGTNDFNFDKLRGKDATGERIRAAAEMLPLMTKRRVVLVRDVQEMPTKELEELAEYFENPAETTCLILHAMTAQKSLDGRLGAVRKMRKAAEEYEFKALGEWEVGAQIERQAAKTGLVLDDAAKAYLVEAIGTDLSQLVGALEKVDLYLGPSEDGKPRRVGGDEVRATVAETRVHSVFDLTDALGARDFERALKCLGRMLLGGESPIGANAMIARHFRIIARLQDPSVRAMKKNEKARAVGAPPFFLKDYERDARKFSASEVDRIRRRIVETDFALKSSRLSDRAIMEGLLYDVCYRDTNAPGATR